MLRSCSCSSSAGVQSVRTRWSGEPGWRRTTYFCGRPSLSDGIDISSLKRVFEVGEEVTLTCEEGYLPSAATPPRISCTSTGEWTQSNLACSQVNCGIPVNIPNGHITFAVMRPHGYKEKVKYACADHYTLDGQAEIQCQNTGNWSSMPVCRAPCTVGIKRGRIFYNAKKLWIQDLKPNRVLHGEHVVFYCLNKAEKCGYPVASTCKDGTLPIPECFEVCIRPELTGNIVIAGIQKSFGPGVVLALSCQQGYTPVSGPPVECGLAPVPKNGMVIYDKKVRGNTTEYSLTATYVCLPPYAISGDPTAECTASGAWTKTPECQDQKPLGTWTVKQGQTLTCSAVFNLQTKEYVAVSDNKVIRIWKEEDIILDKAFKATVSADVWMVHCARGGEPLVLFQRGAVRVLDSLLCDPQQPIEEVLAPEETIRWSTSVVAETQQLLIFRTELKGDHFLYLQRLNPSSVQKYRLEGEESGHTPLSFSASYRDKHIHLLYLYPNGHVYQSVISVRAPEADVAAPAVLLPRSLVLSLPGAGDLLEAASAVVLDDAHVAVVGVPHPSAGAGKGQGSLSFQLLGADGGLYDFGRLLYLLSTVRGPAVPYHNLTAVYNPKTSCMNRTLWSYSNKLFIPHGKTLSVIPFACPKSSLASALGKLKQAKTEESRPLAFVPSWNNILHGDIGRAPKAVEGRKTRGTRKTQPAANLTTDQVLELVKTAPVEEVKQGVQGLLSRHDLTDLQPSLGQLVFTLVSRSMADPALYLPGILAQLVQTRYLCHSVCPDLLLLALEKKDYFLCQLCMQVFPDIPEAFTCACLKAFLSLPDVDAEKLSLDPDSVSFMETLVLKELSQEGLQNGFSPTSTKEDYSDDIGGQQSRTDEATPPKEICPVGLHKAVLLNEVLQTAYSDTFLLPHLKDLSSQHIMDWICMLLDAHFTVLVMTPEAKDLLLNLHRSVQFQVKVFSELGKIEGSLQVLKKMKANRDVGQYSIEVIELF
ncbi:unnamed protein product [Menidia menidia]|uniref:Beta-2-glycoprotein 1 n=1 Tax=Menidia menidia TaxID=238744 RepID=A0A8S4B3U8_9TELE|nr:unnamed protein product [Menidia menidia]